MSSLAEIRQRLAHAAKNEQLVSVPVTDLADLVGAVREIVKLLRDQPCPCGDGQSRVNIGKNGHVYDCEVAAWLARWSESEGT